MLAIVRRLKRSQNWLFHVHDILQGPMLVGFGMVMSGRLDFMRHRSFWCKPLIALLLYLPWFRLAAFQTCIGARISGTAESDLIPSPRVSIVGVNSIAHHQLPEAMHRHFLPNIRGGVWRSIVNCFKHQVLLAVRQREKTCAVAVFGLFINSLAPHAVCFTILRHVLEAISYGLVDEQPMVEGRDDRNLAVRSSVCLRNQVSKNSCPEIPFLRRKELPGMGCVNATGDDPARRLIPERALGKCAEAGIVAWRTARRERIAIEIAR